MRTLLKLQIQRQPTEETCGATCLHAVYRFFGDDISLGQVIDEVEHLPEGGTLAVLLGCHALQRGYRAALYSYNLRIFDPTWFRPEGPRLKDRLSAQREAKVGVKLGRAIDGYLRFLELGGEVRYEDLTPALLHHFLSSGQPVLTGLSATYLYRAMRVFGAADEDDDVRGEPEGHFVVLAGYDDPAGTVRVADPFEENPMTGTPYYEVSAARLIGAILLGVLTYDGNLLVVSPG